MYHLVAVISQFQLARLFEIDATYKVRTLGESEKEKVWSSETFSGVQNFIRHDEIEELFNVYGAINKEPQSFKGLEVYEQAIVIYLPDEKCTLGDLKIKLISHLPNEEVAIPELPKPGRGEGYFFSNPRN